MHSLKHGVTPGGARRARGRTNYRRLRPSTRSGYGFLFYEYSSEPLWDAIKRAKELFADREEWRRLMQRAIALDFSWALAAGTTSECMENLVAHSAVAA